MPRGENIENLKPFKKGHSGNPKGRPKGRRNVKTVLREKLAEQSESGDYASPLAAQLIKIAFKGERDADRLKAVNTIIEKIEGGEQEKENTQIDLSKLSLKEQKTFKLLLDKLKNAD